MPPPVDVRVETMELVTYPPGPDSPYPAYGWIRGAERYPYTMRTDITGQGRPMKHRVVVLENRYVRATVLPDIGGRVYSLFDKVAGKETFMVPPTLKYQNVSARGAWLAGGVEFNFGYHGHTVTTAAKVAWSIQRGADGSAAVWVGSLIAPVESRWAVKVSLRPERAALDMEIHTMAPMALPGLMYWWTNAAVEVTEASRFYYFGLYGNDIHARHSWPVCDGVDFSWYRNRITGSDMFLQEPQQDYMGFYDFGRRHGLAQWADRFEAPGQKYFTWGCHQEGRYWDTMFSETGQTYCEIQRGRHATQAVCDSLPAMTEDSWSETWAPIHDTGGFSAVAGDLVLSVVQEHSGKAEIRLQGLRPAEDLTVEAFAGEQPLGTWRASVGPDRLFHQSLPLPEGKTCQRVKVSDSSGAVLLDWREFQYRKGDWHKPGHDDGQEGPDTADRLFAQAEHARFHNWPLSNAVSEEMYDKVLALDPFHPGALKAKAEMALHNGLPQSALEHLGKALKRWPLDANLLTLKGWTLVRLNRLEEAVEAFSHAARNETARRRALVGLACAHLRAGRADRAGAAVERLLAYCPIDKWGRLMKVIVLRKTGKPDQAAALLKDLLAEDPLWSRLHAEAVLLGVDANLAGGERRLGDDSVSAGVFYVELGMLEEARTIFQIDESNEPLSPAVRLAHLAYAQHRLGDENGAKTSLLQLKAAAVEFAHAWATASLAVLEEMAKTYPDHARLHLMLGNILASRGRIDPAGAAWQRAADLGLENSVVYRNLAAVAAQRKDKPAALALYRRAWSLANRDLNLFAEFDRFLAGAGRHQEREDIYRQLPPELGGRSMVAMRRALQLLDLERWQDAYQEMTARQFYRGEFERGIRHNYMEAVMGVALSWIAQRRPDEALAMLEKGLEYPTNLHVGRNGAMPNESPITYMLGLVCELAGRPDKAREYWTLAAHELHMEAFPSEAYEMLAWLALGNVPRARVIAHRLEQFGRGERTVRENWYWLYNAAGTLKLVHGLAQVFKGDLEGAREIWGKALADEPDCRFLRLHLAYPTELLERMARRVTGPAGGGPSQ